MQLFRTKGQKFLHCPRTKGQRDKFKILPWEGTGRDSLSKSGPGHGTGQLLFFCQNPGRDNCYFFPMTFFLQYLFLFLNIIFLFHNILSCIRMFFSCFRTSFSCFCFLGVSFFVPGRPGTKEFVPGFLLLPLFQDKETRKYF